MSIEPRVKRVLLDEGGDPVVIEYANGDRGTGTRDLADRIDVEVRRLVREFWTEALTRARRI